MDDKIRLYVSVRGMGNTADAYYRARAPWSVCLHFAPDEFEMTMGPLTDAQLERYDLVWAQRPNSGDEELILRMAKDRGLPVIVDVDDDLFDIPPSAGDIFDHYFYRGQAKWTEYDTLNVRNPLAHHQRCLNLADVVTVPTARLAEVIGRYIPSKPRFHVLPNYVLWGDWDWVPRTFVHQWHDQEIHVIGWFGHFYHSHDLQWIAPTLADVVKATGDKFLVMGQPEAKELFPRALCENMLVENIMSFPNLHMVRQMLTTVDVGVCPLMDIPFNQGKSWLKALQFGAAGVVPVCSAVVYDQLPEMVEWGLVAEDADRFGTILEGLLRDDEYRKSLAAEWHQTVRQRYTYESLVFEMDGRRVPNALRWLALAKEVVECGRK